MQVHHPHEAMPLQRYVQRAETMIEAKCPNSPLRDRLDPNLNTIPKEFELLHRWTLLEVYRLVEWISARVQIESGLAGPNAACDLELRIAQGDLWDTITICSFAQPIAA
ncbi:hypothetical protein EST38_g7971 [Candolleomyces aberdarensis]|uniref:Uncharacterized protein n=1 Tax=Candolleomyces aberdarensis TaxID=2316362 RepID=A0A4Q2DH74_9AGAR|nr:hypothetical protein EST38_g7971 [Candolleomyces aberdarensis]